MITSKNKSNQFYANVIDQKNLTLNQVYLDKIQSPQYQNEDRQPEELLTYEHVLQYELLLPQKYAGNHYLHLTNKKMNYSTKIKITAQ